MASTNQQRRYTKSFKYQPQLPPPFEEKPGFLPQLLTWLWEELVKIRTSFSRVHDWEVLTEEPNQPLDAQVRFFEGSPGFDPGKGRGLYYYDEASTPDPQWIFLGGTPTDGGSTPSMSVTDHGDLAGLGDDDHTQYLNVARGDARYYTQTQLDGGQLDTRYYTETEVDALLALKQDKFPDFFWMGIS